MAPLPLLCHGGDGGDHTEVSVSLFLAHLPEHRTKAQCVYSVVASKSLPCRPQVPSTLGSPKQPEISTSALS